MKEQLTIIIIISTLILAGSLNVQARVNQTGDKVFITDRTGVSWEVTQARTLGFTPEGFQYGIGKFAFTPLDDTRVSSSPDRIRENSRVIGFRHKGEAHAYSVDRLRYHELANTKIGDAHITAGY
jgi:hypothetical protein